MSDDNQHGTPDEVGTYRYYNKNNGDLVEYGQPSARLESLQNWVTVESDEHLDELRADNDRNGRGNLLGSSNVGDRVEPRHQVPPETFQPRVEFTEPTVNELLDNRLPAEAYRKDEQPEVVTVDPSKQVEPIAGEGKRDLSTVVLDENLDLTPGSVPIGSGSEDGVLARAHPELEGVEERRQAMIEEQQGSREQGDADAGHTAVREHAADGDDASTKKGVTQGLSGPNPANRPARSATKSEWVDWAVECGADRSEAKDMTKQDLIDIYGD